MRTGGYRSLVSIALLLAVAGALPGASTQRAPQSFWPVQWIADPAFFDRWAEADAPLVLGGTPRSWLWGPVPFAAANEPYAESATGRRLVLYLDKARMEINDPAGDRRSQWYVTSGLLVAEMVSGAVQTGNGSFETREPSEQIVAGDEGSPGAPTYSAFSRQTARNAREEGGTPLRKIGGDGAVTQLAPEDLPVANKVVEYTGYDEVTGHNVPGVFVEWGRARGKILRGGRLVDGAVMDPLYVLGRPMTEAYWADVRVAGKPTRVLVQLFERRALTFNPANPPEWRVEMANAGRAYYAWRYGEQIPESAVAAYTLGESVRVQGWNWRPGVEVRARIELQGDGAALVVSGPVAADGEGRFAITLAVTPQLAGALDAGAPMRVVAEQAPAVAALPFGERASSGPVELEGRIEAVAGGELALRESDGRRWRLVVPQEARLEYSEWETASVAGLSTGTWVAVEGAASRGKVTVAKLRLLSMSRGGAWLGLHVDGGKAVAVVGSGWPARREVIFVAGSPGDSAARRVGSARVDSRGNVAARIAAPPGGDSRGERWLTAEVSEGGKALARVTIPYAEPPRRPPALSLLGQSGEQEGEPGSYCFEGGCSEAIGAPLPDVPLGVRGGDTLGLRSQAGPVLVMGPSPASLAWALYEIVEPGEGVVRLGGTRYMLLPGEPVARGENTGRPLSVPMPDRLAPGEYALVVSAGWDNSAGAVEKATYGFLVSAR